LIWRWWFFAAILRDVLLLLCGLYFTVILSFFYSYLETFERGSIVV